MIEVAVWHVAPEESKDGCESRRWVVMGKNVRRIAGLECEKRTAVKLSGNF
jgi:hypothetical protein